jgi:hypothetical protein
MALMRTHYDNLKVARNAPTEVIRAAYRALAQKHHPDVNISPDSARVMRLLNEAWAILGDPQRRAEHDRWIAKCEKEISEKNVMHGGASNRYRKDQGQANAENSPHVDWYRGKTANRSSATRPPTPSDGRDNFNHSETTGRTENNPVVRLNNWLGTGSGKKWGAALLLLAFFGVFTWLNLKQKSPALSQYAPITQVSRHLDETQQTQESRRETAGPPTKATYKEFTGALDGERQSTAATASPATTRWAPNGKAWPTSAGYLKGFKQRATGGMSKLTIDNTSGGSDVYVKLCTHTNVRCDGLRHVFIPQGSSFSISSIARGTYDIRYRDLLSGAVAQSEAIDMQEIESERGWRYSVVRLTLYRVQGGNTRFSPLTEDQF